MSGARRGLGGPAARAAFGVVLLAVLGLIVFVRPGDDGSAGPGADPPPEPTGVMPTATPANPPTEAEFCDRYRSMAGAQSQYVAVPDDRSAQVLRDAADELLATGIPGSMPVLATGGFFTELSGVYGSIGQTLDPQAMPTAAEVARSEDAPAAFGTYLARTCPAFQG
jgi:hypothetical protein